MEQLGILFDRKAGIIPNENGRVLSHVGHIPGLYCAGWVKRGPTGVIASTMEDAFSTAEAIAEDWGTRISEKNGWEGIKDQIPNHVKWNDWLKIDAAEKERGRAKGKEREKFQSVKEMLDVLQ